MHRKSAYFGNITLLVTFGQLAIRLWDAGWCERPPHGLLISKETRAERSAIRGLHKPEADCVLRSVLIYEPTRRWISEHSSRPLDHQPQHISLLHHVVSQQYFACFLRFISSLATQQKSSQAA